MNDETKAQLNAFVQKILDYASKGADFSAEQVPLLVQEWLKWQAAEAAVMLIVFFIIFVGFVIATKKMWAEKYLPAQGLTMIGAVIVGVRMIYHLLILVKVMIAPRVVIVEKFAEWLK